MKRFLTTGLVLLALIAVPLMSPRAQVIGDGSTVLVLGARYEQSTLGTYGFGFKLGDSPLWQINTVDITNEGSSANAELIALFKLPIGTRFFGGFVSGLNSKWVERSGLGESEFLNYMEGATGVTGVFGFNGYVGVGGYIKRTYPLGDNLLAPDWVGGVAFYLRL